jgi:hypothetical protein
LIKTEIATCSPSAVVHVDLDGASAIYEARGWPYPYDTDPLHESGLINALEFFDNVGLKATLFVVAQDLEDARKRALIKEAVIRGHDLASHSVTHRKLTALDRENKCREIFESRERISAEFEVEVLGFRSPHFDMDSETLDLVAEAGYTYDSSLFPVSGFPFASSINKSRMSPYYPLDNRSLLELPLPVLNPLPIPFHPCYSLFFGQWYFRLGLRRFRQLNMPFVLLFHLTDFADPLPIEQLRSWRARLFTLSHMTSEHKMRRCKQMLDLLVRAKYQLTDTIQLLYNWTNSDRNDSNRGE